MTTKWSLVFYGMYAGLAIRFLCAGTLYSCLD